MARPTTLPDQAQAVEHLPTQLPAIPAEVTLPATAAEKIAALDFSHLPDWFPLESAQVIAAQDHRPTDIPPPPPVGPPETPASHLTDLPDTAHVPEWLLPLV
jgi:hypothetical protein